MDNNILLFEYIINNIGNTVFWYNSYNDESLRCKIESVYSHIKNPNYDIVNDHVDKSYFDSIFFNIEITIPSFHKITEYIRLLNKDIFMFVNNEKIRVNVSSVSVGNHLLSTTVECMMALPKDYNIFKDNTENNPVKNRFEMIDLD